MRLLPLLLIGLLGCATGESDFDCDGHIDTEDCAPADPSAYPGAPDPWPDDQDQDCDGRDGVDRDGDGAPANLPIDDPRRDCDDGDAAIRPGAVEVDADGVDQDCDGLDVADGDGDGTRDSQDCAPSVAGLNAQDEDGDGRSTCDGDCDDQDAGLHDRDLDGDGLSPCGGDCDDLNPLVRPGLPELCDGLDNDCDGVVGAGEEDGDGDGDRLCQGDCDDSDPALNTRDDDGDGWSSCHGDCDDEDAARSPQDADNDGVSRCHFDCDDANAAIRPGLAEQCDGIDNDCDGAVPAAELDADGDGAWACKDCDDDDPAVSALDGDGDGFDACTGDCAPGNPAAWPGAPDPWGDGIDQSCDGIDGEDADADGFAGNAPSLGPLWDCDDADPSRDRSDTDGDGVDSCAGDCDDTDPGVAPGQVESCDGLDVDCVDDPEELDGDGDGVRTCAGDCDDADPDAHPLDLDSDGFDTCGPDIDCDDSDPSIRPDQALDAWGDAVDANCDGSDVFDLGGAWATLVGEDLGDGFGSAVLGTDLNGDGRAELLAGSPDLSLDNRQEGAAYLFDAAAVHAGMVSFSAASTWIGGGGWHERAGRALAVVPDTNSDGADELFVLSDAHACSMSRADALTGGDLALPAGGGCLTTAGGGVSLAGGDVDGDGVEDLVVASSGRVYVMSSSTLPWAPEQPSAAVAPLELVGPAADGFGASVAVVGDLDFDGASEILVGAPDGANGGSAWLFLSGDLPSMGEVDASQAAWGVQGSAGVERVGATLLALPDLDGDGRGDFAVAAPASTPDAARPGAGEVALFTGASILGGTTVTFDQAWLRLRGQLPDEELGVALALVPDVDGDGTQELLVGGPGADGVWLVGGTVLAAGGVVDASVALSRFEGAPGDRAGSALAAAGDIDGDGVGDLVIGAPQSGIAGPGVGAVYVVRGSP